MGENENLAHTWGQLLQFLSSRSHARSCDRVGNFR